MMSSGAMSSAGICTLSLHDALPISGPTALGTVQVPASGAPIALMADHQTTGGYPRIAEIAYADVPRLAQRSEEHTSELQSRFDLVCRLLLEKKKGPARLIRLMKRRG